jgi:uncharacterized protein (TIGR02147 family)
VADFFHINDPLVMIQNEVEQFLAEGRSYRDLAKNCGFKSSNYVQMLLAKKRRLTLEVAKQIAKGLKLTQEKKEFLTLLVKQSTLSGKPLADVQKKLDNMRAEGRHESIEDQSLYDAWFHSVIYEMSGLEGFDGNPVVLSSRLGGLVTPSEASASLEFLKAKGWLVESPDGTYVRKAIHFSAGNKNRSIKMQTMHKRFLEMAIHRLNDDLSHRVYQGMTIAIPWSKFSIVKDMMRNFIDDLEKELTVSDPSDEVVRIQCCAFKITR